MIVRAAVSRARLNLTHRQRVKHGAPGAWVLMQLRQLSLGVLLAGLLTLPNLGAAQATKPVAGVGKPLATTPAKATASGQSWAELTPTQQQALMPLASSWNTGMSEAQRRKWLKISKNFPSLSPQEQAVMYSRMKEWVSLTPQQRAQARLNFGKTRELSKQLTSEEKKTKWQAYQALSAEEKQKLAKAGPKPAGAAAAVKPVARQKLAIVHPHVNKPVARAAAEIASSPAVAASRPAGQLMGEPGGVGTEPQR
ncbi:MAG: DUF3106 domain-containing protein [Polaromonas sp.]|nr:DUF3106 domain-containing protein [Polaromonas sp.]